MAVTQYNFLITNFSQLLLRWRSVWNWLVHCVRGPIYTRRSPNPASLLVTWRRGLFSLDDRRDITRDWRLQRRRLSRAWLDGRLEAAVRLRTCFTPTSLPLWVSDCFLVPASPSLDMIGIKSNNPAGHSQTLKLPGNSGQLTRPVSKYV